MRTGEVSWDKVTKGPVKEFGLYSSGSGKLLRRLKCGHAMFSFAS